MEFKHAGEQSLKQILCMLRDALRNKVDSVDGKALSSNDFTDAEKSKLAGIEDNANNYSHPAHTAKTSGLYKITVDSQGHVSGATKVTKSDITSLGIPGENTDTVYDHPNHTSRDLGLYKVQVDGEGHVSNVSSVTKSDITALGIPAQDTQYTHPSHTAKNSGLYKVTVDSQGHVSAATAVTKSDITALGIPGSDTQYTHPSYTAKSSGLYKVTVDGTGHVSAATAVAKSDITGLGIPGSDTNNTYDLSAPANKTNGNVKLNLTVGGTGSGTSSDITIKGSGATTVTTDANGNVIVSSSDTHTTLAGLGVTASSTELNYVKGVTSAIQTQLDSKASKDDLNLYVTLTPTELDGAEAFITSYDYETIAVAIEAGRSVYAVYEVGSNYAILPLLVREDDTLMFAASAGTSVLTIALPADPGNLAITQIIDMEEALGLREHILNSDVHLHNDEKSKLAGIEAGANKTVVDTALSSTSTNPVQNKVVNTALGNKLDKSSVDSSISSTSTNPVQNKVIYTALAGKLATSLKGAANGLAELDSTGKVPSSQLPSYVDDVIEGYLSSGKFYKESTKTTQITGESGKIYIDLTSGANKTYRWSGSAFAEISASLALGETSSTAYRGDRGKIAYDHAVSAHNYSASGHKHTVSHTPAGTVSSTFTGTAHGHTFTGSAVTSAATASGSVTSIYSITGVGTLPSASLDKGTLPSLEFSAGTLPSAEFSKGSHSFSAGTLPSASLSAGTLPSLTFGAGTLPSLTPSCANRKLTLTFGAGTLPSASLSKGTYPTLTFSAGTLPSASWTAPSLTFSAGSLPSAEFSAGTLPDLTFSAGSLPTRSSAISVAKGDHKHSVTAAGTISETTAGGSVSSGFSGTAATLTTSVADS